jgi:hypothetical protein
MARGDFPSAKQDQFVLRFPSGMRDRIKVAAERNGRSMNAEIVARIELADEVPRLREVHNQLRAQNDYLRSENDKIKKMTSDGNLPNEILARKIIPKLLKKIEDPNGNDSELTNAEYEAVLYMTGFPLSDIGMASQIIAQERFIERATPADRISEGYRERAQKLAAEILSPVVRYMESKGWKVEPPADWPKEIE